MVSQLGIALGTAHDVPRVPAASTSTRPTAVILLCISPQLRISRVCQCHDFPARACPNGDELSSPRFCLSFSPRPRAMLFLDRKSEVTQKHHKTNIWLGKVSHKNSRSQVGNGKVRLTLLFNTSRNCTSPWERTTCILSSVKCPGCQGVLGRNTSLHNKRA